MISQEKTYVIVEAGVNHDGSEDKARQLIDIAAAAGADAVKFQLFDPQALTTAGAPTADYQSKNLKDGNVSQQEMLRKLSLPREAFGRLAEYCKKQDVDFLCTPFDQDSLEYLVKNTTMPYLKLASGEVTNGPLLAAAARTGLPVILSTGMSDMEEIAAALAVLRDARGITLLHCVSQYPAPAHAMNLRAMDTMREKFKLPVGLSDHSVGIALAIAAAARGAVMIEKHFTYDKNASGPDHKASLAPEELKAMIAAIRDVEKALGDGVKRCVPEEENTRAVARRSIVAAGAIARGAAFSEDNLICKRPADGISPMRFAELLGKKAGRSYAADDIISSDELS